jgi:hypothetical protein
MDHLKICVKLVDWKKWFMTILTTIFILFVQKKCDCMPFTAKGNVIVAEWSTSSPITHIGALLPNVWGTPLWSFIWLDKSYCDRCSRLRHRVVGLVVTFVYILKMEAVGFSETLVVTSLHGVNAEDHVHRAKWWMRSVPRLDIRTLSCNISV